MKSQARRLRVLMFGWEYPPAFNGGLGMVCHQLSIALAQDIDIVFVLPKKMDTLGKHATFLFPEKTASYGNSSITVHGIDSPLTGYLNEASYLDYIHGLDGDHPYGTNLLAEVLRYAHMASDIIKDQDVDVVHAHDWLTFGAGIAAKNILGKPLVAHIHNTIFDRGLGNAHPMERELEYKGLAEADHIIAVSGWTKDTIVQNYNIPEEKISIVHNQINPEARATQDPMHEDFLSRLAEQNTKIILSLGRITVQKGIDYLIEAMRLVNERYENAVLIVAGDGDMKGRVMEQAAEAGIAHKVFFPGFVTGFSWTRLYTMADIFVMPSVSEPFGLVALEAALHDTPVIVSKQSGVAEVLPHALTVDFWDTHHLADLMVHILSDPFYAQDLVEKNHLSLVQMGWRKASKLVQHIYRMTAGVFNLFKSSKQKRLPPQQEN